MTIQKILIFVEGPSDQAALSALLQPLIDRLIWESGISIEFFPATKGDRKTYLMVTVPETAATILLNNPQDAVIVLPDLYPRNKHETHETAEQLVAIIQRNFMGHLQKRSNTKDLAPQITERFKVFCLKYDLEALILASVEALCSQLGVKSLSGRWTIPVEDQNHERHPKLIVDELFQEYLRQPYIETVDAPLILGKANYKIVADRCPQCFKPFVEYLEGVGEATPPNDGEE